jgi:hypothetical protein
MADDKTYDNHDLEVMPLMVQVTAPTTLPAGYTFEALVNDDPDRPFTCEVVRRTGPSCSQHRLLVWNCVLIFYRRFAFKYSLKEV